MISADSSSSSGGVFSSSSSSRFPVSRRKKSVKKKQRCWSFIVTGINRNGPEKKKLEILSSFRERYTAVKKLTLSPVRGPDTGNTNTWDDARAVVQFIGPQPSHGPGELLLHLLSGTSVKAEPIVLGRGRKKRPRYDGDSSGTSDYELEDSGRSEPRLEAIDESTKLACEDTKSAFGGHLGPVRRAQNLPPSRGLPQIPTIELFKYPSTARVMPPATHTVESDKDMQWDEVISRVEPPSRQRGLPAPQHSLDLGYLYVSGESDDDTPVDAAYSEDVDLDPEPNFNAPGKMISWRGGTFIDEASKAAPFFRRFESTHRNLPAASGRGILEHSSYYSSQIESRDLSEHSNMLQTAAMDKSVSSTDFDPAFNAGRYDRIGASAVRLEDGFARIDLSPALQSVEPLQRISVQPVQMSQECDFDGIPALVDTATDTISGIAFQAGGGCRLSFAGLDRLRQPLQNIEATAYFRAGAGHAVSSVAGPIQQGPMNRAYATLFYPSMQEIWPEVYALPSIRTVKVDMWVEVRSTESNFRHTEPDMQVLYRRSLVPEEDAI